MKIAFAALITVISAALFDLTVDFVPGAVAYRDAVLLAVGFLFHVGTAWFLYKFFSDIQVHATRIALLIGAIALHGLIVLSVIAMRSLSM